jgi:TPR repeat protein
LSATIALKPESPAFMRGEYVKLYEKSCNGRFVDACLNLGFIYEAGDGVAKDYKKAKKLYQKACELNSKEGCKYLAFFYEYGKGVEKDIKKAIYFYQKSCEQGLKSACTKLQEIKK